MSRLLQLPEEYNEDALMQTHRRCVFSRDIPFAAGRRGVLAAKTECLKTFYTPLTMLLKMEARMCKGPIPISELVIAPVFALRVVRVTVYYYIPNANEPAPLPVGPAFTDNEPAGDQKWESCTRTSTLPDNYIRTVNFLFSGGIPDGDQCGRGEQGEELGGAHVGGPAQEVVAHELRDEYSCYDAAEVKELCLQQ